VGKELVVAHQWGKGHRGSIGMGQEMQKWRMDGVFFPLFFQG